MATGIRDGSSTCSIELAQLKDQKKTEFYDLRSTYELSV